MTNARKPILDVLERKTPERVPFWLMRQAGRYLPEYLDLRKQAGGFLDLVYDPEKAAEVTVQPLRRFGMDAAILFSDILVVPHALGQSVRFEAGEGPRLDPIRSERDLAILDPRKLESIASPVYETVSKTREKMTAEGFDETALIGFCGSPWTVACYMVEGGGSKDFEIVRQWALGDPASFQTLIDIITEVSCEYLAGQIRAGAEAVQLFDSWSGLLDHDEFHRWVIEPTKKIRDYLREYFPHIRVIGFPRGAGMKTKSYAIETGVDCVGLDPTIDPRWAAAELQPVVPVQGNLDPIRLLCGDTAMDDAMNDLYNAFGHAGWIFNLGHGVIKETKVDNVMRLKNIVRGWKVAT